MNTTPARSAAITAIQTTPLATRGRRSARGRGLGLGLGAASIALA